MKYKSIKTTELGVISGRDAIFIDRFSHVSKEGVFCILEGEINLDLVGNREKYTDVRDGFVSYVLTFKNAISFRCLGLECSSHEEHMISSFDLVEDLDEFMGLPKESFKPCRLYLVQTYDFLYEIMASDYRLELKIQHKNVE